MDLWTGVSLAACASIALALSAAAGERLAGRAHVLDGDTIVVNGIHVRLKGVAAPEVAHYAEPGELGGEAAKTFMVHLVEGQVVACDLTQERTHGRRVGLCFRESRDKGAELIKDGLAGDCPGRCFQLLHYGPGRLSERLSARQRA